METPYATSYQRLIVTGILSRTVSELSQLIVQILDTLRFEPPFGRLEVTYDTTMIILGSLQSA